MTFLDLVNLTLRWLDDLNAGYFTLPQVKAWLNNAQKETQKLLIQAGENWYVRVPVCTDTIVGQSCYFLPQDFLKVRRLELVMNAGTSGETSQFIVPITQNEQDALGSQWARPTAYYLLKNVFVLKATPDNVYHLRLNYVYRVPDMVLDDEVPDIPEEYHEFLAVLATIDGLLKDRRDISSLVEKRNYYQGMFVKDAEQRRVDKPRQVVTTSTDQFWSPY